MSEQQIENETAGGQSALSGLVRWFAPHIRDWAIIYVIACYLIFVIVNITWLHINVGDTYGIAMVLIGFFWLSVMAIASLINNRAT